MFLVRGLLGYVSTSADFVWDFENDNSLGLILQNINPPTPVFDDHRKAGDETLMGGLPGVGMVFIDDIRLAIPLE